MQGGSARREERFAVLSTEPAYVYLDEVEVGLSPRPSSHAIGAVERRLHNKTRIREGRIDAFVRTVGEASTRKRRIRKKPAANRPGVRNAEGERSRQRG